MGIFGYHMLKTFDKVYGNSHFCFSNTEVMFIKMVNADLLNFTAIYKVEYLCIRIYESAL